MTLSGYLEQDLEHSPSMPLTHLAPCTVAAPAACLPVQQEADIQALAQAA
jgi:hypothetical protein